MQFRYGLIALFLSTLTFNLLANDCVNDSTIESNDCINECNQNYAIEEMNDYNHINDAVDASIESYDANRLNAYTNSYINDCTIIKACLEFLYLKPCVERDECAFRGHEFADESSSFNTGLYECWKYSWRPSFRMYLAKDFGCGTVAASYQFLNNKASRQFTATETEEILTSPIHSGFASFENFSLLVATHQFDYHHFDLFFEQPFNLFCLDLLIPYIGIDGLVLNQKIFLQGPSADPTSSEYLEESQKANYWGLGLKVGSSLLYSINSCFDLFAQIGASIIYGPLDEVVSSSLITFGSNSNLRTTCNTNLLIPSLKLRFGFDFHISECFCPFTARFGYEFIEWFNVWAYRVATNPDVNNITKSNRGNLQFNGLTIGILVAF